MVSANDTVYLISGANRGIGFGLVQHLSKRSGVTVYAGTRDISKATALQALSKVASNVHVVQLTSADKPGNQAAIKQIEHQSGHLDVVIANAGVGSSFAKAATVDPSQVLKSVETNAIGPLVLFQAAWPLLQQSSKPIFTVVSTVVGSNGMQSELQWPTTDYGGSKALVNYIVLKIHYENEGLIAFPVHPGWVQTDMGNEGAVANGLEKAPVTVDDSVSGILKLVDSAERATTSGKFLGFDGKELPW